MFTPFSWQSQNWESWAATRVEPWPDKSGSANGTTEFDVQLYIHPRAGLDLEKLRHSLDIICSPPADAILVCPEVPGSRYRQASCRPDRRVTLMRMDVDGRTNAAVSRWRITRRPDDCDRLDQPQETVYLQFNHRHVTISTTSCMHYIIICQVHSFNWDSSPGWSLIEAISAVI